MTGLGAGVVVSASGRRLSAIGQGLLGRKLRVAQQSRSMRQASEVPRMRSADVHLLALQQLEHFARPCQWALLCDDVLARAIDSGAARAAVRGLVAEVDAVVVSVSPRALVDRFSTLLGLGVDAAFVAPQSAVEPVRAGASTKVPVRSLKEATPAASSGVASTLAPKDAALFEALRVWRRSEAQRRGVPAYRVLPDRVLRVVATERPREAAELLVISGIGEKTVAESGRSLLDAVAAHQGGGPLTERPGGV
ncbi:MAG: HRDC domain-containing protein [Deltaproteobacteria bacterium]|nr:HRDC domain-containing protein [Deltaproteobacteria bacterium]